MTAEEQAAEDERAREAALASMASMGDVEGETASALAPVTGGTPRRVDLGEQPELDHITAAPAPEENTDLTSGVAGVDGIHDYDFEAPTYGPDGEAVAPAPVAPAAPTQPASEAALPTAKPDTEPAREAPGPRPSLDDGLPSEEQIGSARSGDVLRRILHALGNGLMVAGGRSATEFQSDAEPLEQERRAGLRAALERKGQARAQEGQAAATSARQAIQDRLAQRQAEQRDRALEIQQQQADTSARSADTLASQREASTAHVSLQDEMTRATREERQDPQSGVSRGMRDAIRTRLGLLPDAEVARIGEDFPDLARIDEMTAEELEPVLRAMTTGVGIRTRGAASGSGGGGREALVAEMVRRGILSSEEEARQHVEAVGTRGARSELQAAMSPTARARTGAGEGVEILPGVRATLADSVEARAIRTAFTQARTQYASLGAVDEIAQRFGASGPISPEAAGELGGPLSRLRAMVASLQNTGVINPSEAPTIEAMLPDPRSVSQMTFQTLQGRLRSFRRELDSQVTSALATRGVDDEGVRTALQQLHGGAASGGGERVRVRRLSDGRSGSVTPAYLAAHADEYEEVR